MAQFDTLLIFPILWSLIIIFIFNYSLIIHVILPEFFSLLKFRKKIIKISKPKVLKLKTIYS
jgi:hypothetical protein